MIVALVIVVLGNFDASKPNVCINKQPYASTFSNYKASVYPHLLKKLINYLLIYQSQ